MSEPLFFCKRNELCDKDFTTVSNRINVTSSACPLHSTAGNCKLPCGFAATRSAIDVQSPHCCLWFLLNPCIHFISAIIPLQGNFGNCATPAHVVF